MTKGLAGKPMAWPQIRRATARSLTEIGRATSVLLAREGASVVAAGRRTELGEGLIAQLTAEGLLAHFIETNVSAAPQRVAAVAARNCHATVLTLTSHGGTVVPPEDQSKGWRRAA